MDGISLMLIVGVIITCYICGLYNDDKPKPA
jgi:hypothetical protein